MNVLENFKVIGFGKIRKTWWRRLLIVWLVCGVLFSCTTFWYMNSQAAEKRKEMLTNLCDERARILHDQFNVSINNIKAMAELISIFDHGKNPSAIDQRTFAKYTDKTSIERPLTSGVAYAVRVLDTEREQFEAQHGWSIKRMDSRVHEDEFDPAGLEPAPVHDEYAPVLFAQSTVAHVISIDCLSGKEDRENILRSRESGKGVLTAPFKLLKTNRLGVIFTFAVYKQVISTDTTPAERIEATLGYLGGIFDVTSLVDKLLEQFASKHTVFVNVYDTTNKSLPITMYGSNTTSGGLHRVSALDFGDPFRKHEMHCRFKQHQPWPWVAITTWLGSLIITFLVAYIICATMNRIPKVEDDFEKMTDLKKRAEAADMAKTQFLATVSHEIRTPMHGVLGMLGMLMGTDLDETQQDYVRTARESGKALVSLIDEVLDQSKIESGKLELESASFDLRAILDDVISLFSGKSQEKKVELAVYVSSKIPATLFGDPGRFRQIVTNLVGNSIKFTDKGHIFVTVDLVEEVKELMELERDSQNTLSGLPVVDRRESWAGFKIFNQEKPTASSSAGDHINIIVSVEDTGKGIPLEAQPRVFDLFMQVDPSITRTHGGTGIGLSISKSLVHLMKGEIGLASSIDIGSTFTFTAVFTNGCSNNQTNNQSNSSEIQGIEALVVDPNPVRAKVSRYHIERAGIHVDQAITDLNQPSNTINMIFIEEEIWDRELASLTNFFNNLREVDPPTLLLLSSSSRTSFMASGVPKPCVVRKPLRASMVGASVRRALGGTGTRGNNENRGSLRHLLRGRKILVVDDNRVNLRIAAAALKNYGADVVLAERGKEAIALLTPPHQFDVCFMDIQMPEMDGLEATKRIRDIEGGDRQVPILALTANQDQATYEKCFESGMNGYAAKPFEPEQLYNQLSGIFQTLQG